MAQITDRNERAWGEENQKKLNESSVLVVGTDAMAQMVLGGLAGLSIGNVHFTGNERIKRYDKDFLVSHENNAIGQKKVRHIEDTLGRVNETVNFNGIHSKFAEAFVYTHKPEIIIDATNDPISKEKALSYALSYNIPFISGSSDDGKASVAAYFPKNKGKIKVIADRPDLDAILMREFEGKEQGGFSSSVIAGLIVEEVRKAKFQYDENDANLESNVRLTYNVLSDVRKGEDSNGASMPLYFKGKKSLVVGGGGIGNFVALNLALLGVGTVDIIDLDDIDETNLNRQILFYGKAGSNKSDVLSERIKEIDSGIKSNGIHGMIGKVDLPRDEPWLREMYEIDKALWDQEPASEAKWKNFPNFGEYVNIYFGKRGDLHLITEKEIAKKKYDVIFGCFDNKYARMWLNNFAVNNKVVYIDGGTGPTSGQLAAYIPGKTKCVDCQLHVKRYRRENMSCADQAEGSVVMSNMIIGGAMVGEAVRALYNLGEHKSEDFRYRVSDQSRIGMRRRRRELVTRHAC